MPIRLLNRSLSPVILIGLTGLLGPAACAATDIRTEGLAPASDTETAIYSQHLFSLANEFMQGRKPGTPGIEKAAQYIEFHFDRLGLEPAFESDDGSATWRQGFIIGEDSSLESQSLAIVTPDRNTPLESAVDFNALAYGSSGDTTLPVTFVGYSIPQGSDGYSSFDGKTDLTGKAAMVLLASCGEWNRLRKAPIAASRPCCWRWVRWLSLAVVVTAAKTRC